MGEREGGGEEGRNVFEVGERGQRSRDRERGACCFCICVLTPFAALLSLPCSPLSLLHFAFSLLHFLLFFFALSPESRSGEEGRSRAVLACGEGGGAEEEGGGTYGSGLKEVDAAFARRK
jgi:hypothetical protein